MRWLLALWLLLVGLAGVVSPSLAQSRVHVVESGQRLESIAKRYNVSIEALCEANGISRRAPIKPRQRLTIPDPKGSSKAPGRSPSAGAAPSQPTRKPTEQAFPHTYHVVQPGQRLGTIAKRYRTSVQAIAHASEISPKNPLRPGQKLVIPHARDRTGEHALEAARKERRAEEARERELREARIRARGWEAYLKAPWKRGYVHLVGYRRSWKGYAIGPDDKVLPRARQAFSDLLNASDRWPQVDPRLIRLLVRISDDFGGRQIRIVSGLRGTSYVRNSKHRLGRAVDFSIVGVPNEALRDYLLTLDSVGVGYYPRSSFVHLDVRDEEKAYWVDYAGPGEPPKLAPRNVSLEALRRIEAAADH
jgi:LysM repeat protein